MKKNSNQTLNKSKKSLQLIHADLLGLISKILLSGTKLFVVFIDDYS